MTPGTRYESDEPIRLSSGKLVQIPLSLTGTPSAALRAADGGIEFVTDGWFEVLLSVEWDPTNLDGTRFCHTKIVDDEQPLHSEAIAAGVLADVSDGRQLLRGNGVFGPSTSSRILLEAWHDSAPPVVVRRASLTVRELCVPWPP